MARRALIKALSAARAGGLCLLLGCAGSASAGPRPAPLPADQDLRRQSLDALARALFEALRAQAPERALAPVQELDALLPADVRSRIERERLNREGQLTQRADAQLWARATYAGFCAQGAREDPPFGVLGLRDRAWLLDRMLVVASLGTARSASWVEGRFLYTDRGWRALSLSRVEPPRAGHADLELAPCDVEQGIR